MKGIILAGGKATRLHPITRAVCKQLLPVYDKPMIYYPLSALLLAGVREILIISTAEALPQFQALFGDGADLGLSIRYRCQDEPRGIAEAFLLGASFIGTDPVWLVLGDNMFFGEGLSDILQNAGRQTAGATVFAYYVSDPQRYGVVSFDAEQRALSIEEKPAQPKTHWAVTGLYRYDAAVVAMAAALKPSARGELEITDINNIYLRNNALRVAVLGRGFAWLDAGTYDSLIDASIYIKTVEQRQGLKIGCIEEIAYRMRYITAGQLHVLARRYNTSYGEYLLSILREDGYVSAM